MRIADLLQRVIPPLWCGVVCGIALEARLKFLAPGVTREIGLGIGKIVFTAINRVECALALLLALALFAGKSRAKPRLVFGVVALILAAQTFWLVPGLAHRVDLIVSGQPPPPAPLHLYFVFAEGVKVLLLLVLSVLAQWPETSKTEMT
jgi:hypothetical protein